VSGNVVRLPSRPVATVAPDRYLTRDEVARHLGVSTKTIDRMLRDGLPCHRFGRRLVRLRLGEVETWLQRRH
jgi:excisionase family DNA binding protein